jgi:hypothetical protein
VALPPLPVVGAAVAAGTLVVVELWLEAADDVVLESVVAVFSAVLDDADLPAYDAAAA